MRELKWFEQRNSLTQLIKSTTRNSKNDSCIDLIFTNSNFIADKGVLDVNLNDHELIFTTRKHVKKVNTSSEFKGRSYIIITSNVLRTN